MRGQIRIGQWEERGLYLTWRRGYGEDRIAVRWIRKTKERRMWRIGWLYGGEERRTPGRARVLS